jgi:DNA-binding CsgD family transcriptional regulator
MARPSLIITDSQRDQVAQWIRARVPIERMASRLGMAPKTFRKHFALQLGTADIPDAAPLLPDEILPSQLSQIESYRPTGEVRDMVLVLVGADISRPEIARKLGISVETLEFHFADELNNGTAIAQGNVILQMYNAARGGNVSAMKTYLLLGNRRSEAERDKDREPAQPSITLGKKEQQQLESSKADAGTPWERVLN